MKLLCFKCLVLQKLYVSLQHQKGNKVLTIKNKEHGSNYRLQK